MTAVRQNGCVRMHRRSVWFVINTGRLCGAIGASLMTLATVVALAALFSLSTLISRTASAHAETPPGPILSDLPAAPDTALRLVMVAVEGCPFCIRWQSQVGHLYPQSPEGKMAPLVRVRFGAPGLAGFKKIKFTPTFLILKGNTEVGRIAGYPGADPFWEELGLILKPLTGQHGANVPDNENSGSAASGSTRADTTRDDATTFDVTLSDRTPKALR